MSVLPEEISIQKRFIMKILWKLPGRSRIMGLKYLHLVDLDGAKNKKIENIKGT